MSRVLKYVSSVQANDRDENAVVIIHILVDTMVLGSNKVLFVVEDSKHFVGASFLPMQ